MMRMSQPCHREQRLKGRAPQSTEVLSPARQTQRDTRPRSASWDHACTKKCLGTKTPPHAQWGGTAGAGVSGIQCLPETSKPQGPPLT